MKYPVPLAIFGALLLLGPSAAADQRDEVIDAQGRVIRVLAGDGSARDVAPLPQVTTAEPPLARRPVRGTDGRAARRAVAPAEAWPMFQGNATHTGYLPVSLDPTLFSLRWRKNVGSNIALNPVTAGEGKVFVTLMAHYQDVPSLFALRSLDGATLWSKGFGSISEVNPPSYAYGNVYLQTGNGTDSWLRAYEVATGASVFQVPYEAQWERYFAPTISDGKVYVNGGYFGGMYRFDAFTGARDWYVTLPQYDQWTPAVAGGTAYAYVGSYAPGLYGKDAATGAPVLFVPDPDFVWAGWSMNLAPVVGGHGDVIVTQWGRLIAFDTALGTIRWQLDGQFHWQPSVAHDRIYAINGPRVSVIDELTAAELWWWQPPAGTLYGPVIVTDTHVFASTLDTVYAVDLATGLTAWSYPAGGHLALADATLFVASANGVLTAVTVAHVTPVALAVDDAGGNANGIVEPGETAGIEPTWRAGGVAVSAVSGSAVAVGDFAVVDDTASYGDLGAGESKSCVAGGDCYGVAVNGTRPGTHWDVTLHETLNTGDQHDWRLHIGSSFGDVPSASATYPFVETILHQGVTAGCAPNSYCPGISTNRAQMAVFALLSKEIPGYVPPACGGAPMFADVPIPSLYCRWIEELARRGVVSGCGGGNYCPGDPVTRAQMAVFVLRTLDPTLDPPACASPVFADVPATSLYCRWIEELARRGVVAGCGGGNYCPAAPVTRDQMAVFLTLTFGLTIYGP